MMKVILTLQKKDNDSHLKDNIMTRKILLLVTLAILVFGCGKKKVIESTYENGNPRVIKYFHKEKEKLVLDREEVYYENKVHKMEGTYKNDQRDGQWKAWYENGTIWSEGEYKEGKRNGLGIAYHQNGKKYIEGTYKDDLRVGIWRFYDTLGLQIKEVDFNQIHAAAANDSVN